MGFQGVCWDSEKGGNPKILSNKHPPTHPNTKLIALGCFLRVFSCALNLWKRPPRNLIMQNYKFEINFFGRVLFFFVSHFLCFNLRSFAPSWAPARAYLGGDPTRLAHNQGTALDQACYWASIHGAAQAPFPPRVYWRVSLAWKFIQGPDEHRVKWQWKCCRDWFAAQATAQFPSQWVSTLYLQRLDQQDVLSWQ